MRMTPAEMRASVLDSNQIGSSGLSCEFSFGSVLLAEEAE
jgi:hypothetical protein